MNKLITICLLLLAAWTQGNAQNTLGSIRERYAGIKSDIAEMMKRRRLATRSTTTSR